MMQLPLLISSLLVHAERHHGEQEVVSRRVEGDIHRTTFRELAQRSRQHGQRPGWPRHRRAASASRTLAWNGYRHLELYYAVSGSGAVLHTLNPRLHPDQVVYIADHAEDQALFFDLTFLPLVEAIAPCASRRSSTFVAMTDRAAHAGRRARSRTCCATRSSSPPSNDSFVWPTFDENQRLVALLHRRARPATRRACSTATARRCCTPSRSPCPTRLNCSAQGRDPAGRADVPRQRLGPAIRGLHDGLRSWSSRAPGLDGKSLYELFENERVTLSAGVPTVVAGPARLRRRQRPASSRPCGARSSAARPARRR